MTRSGRPSPFRAMRLHERGRIETSDKAPQERTMSNTAPHAVIENIDQVARGEEELAERRGLGERLGDLVGTSAGTLAFVCGQLVFVLGWALVNAGLVPGLPVFDPFPYSLLSGLLSLEGVLLTCFVLIKQAHESRLSERRSHLNLQANLLTEKEVTKLIQMLERMSAAEGTQDRVTDEETRELGQVTAVGELARELDRRLDQ